MTDYIVPVNNTNAEYDQAGNVYDDSADTYDGIVSTSYSEQASNATDYIVPVLGVNAEYDSSTDTYDSPFTYDGGVNTVYTSVTG